jgi:CubicO group peptidase (beta-lactamase class C family)
MNRIINNLFFLFSFCVLLTSCQDEEAIVTGGYNWTTASTEELGLNSKMIDAAFNEALAKGFINSIIIVRNGKIGAEKYFNGKDKNSYQTIRSVSKSFLSAMIGIAFEKGLIKLDNKVVEYFPEYKSDINDSRINNITIEHILRMRSGIKGDEEIYFTFTNSSNWIKTILGLPLEFEPGSKSLYSTAGTHLLAAVLAKVSGMSLLSFGKIYLFDPMNIKIRDWVKDPQGYYFGGNDMYFTTRDMATLGLLYMNKGKLNNNQIVPEDWAVKSIASQSAPSTGSWGKLTKYGYGYLWWSGVVAEKQVYFALGHGGQYVLCVPSLDMIIAVNSYPDSDWTQADEQERAVLDIIADYIIPAAN